MRVLHVVPSFYPAFVYGGPIYSVYELCSGLAQLGCEVQVLTTDANGPRRVLDVPKGQDVILHPGFSVRYCRRLCPHSVSAEFLLQLPQAVRWADLIHLTGVYSFPTFPVIFLARLFRKKIVWSPRGCLKNWAGSRRNTLKALWTKTANALAGPQTVLHLTSQQELSGSEGRFPRFRRSVIFNGVTLPQASSHRPEEPGRPLKLLFLGRIHPIKNIENLLRACSFLNDTLSPPWSLVIAGPGDPAYVHSLQSLAASLGLTQVRFLGEVLGEEKEQLFRFVDVAVVPSHAENFGMVIAESLAHAVPVIASKSTPWSDLERIGCGLWVPNDPPSLARAIFDISTRPLREMGRRGREWMRAEFSWPSIAQQMLDLYREMMNEERQAGLATPAADRIQSWGA